LMPKKDLETSRISRIGPLIVPPGAQCILTRRLVVLAARFAH